MLMWKFLIMCPLKIIIYVENDNDDVGNVNNVHCDDGDGFNLNN